MGTAVFFHAHPDDEALFTGGTMARAAAEGHRVVLVTATRGERGVDRSGNGAPGGSLGERREGELREAAASLNVSRCHVLGFEDSGIDGDARAGFCQAPADEAALRLAEVIRDEGADVLVTYDQRGIYGHPDHIQIHKVALRAAQLVPLARIYLATIDRARLQAGLRQAEAFGLGLDDETLDWAASAGMAGERITVTVDVGGYLGPKRDALAAHRTQFPPGTALLGLPEAVFQAIFGTEWYIELGGSQARCWLWD